MMAIICMFVALIGRKFSLYLVAVLLSGPIVIFGVIYECFGRLFGSPKRNDKD